uniref:Uncharacterized protein n=1 Tax=Arundo donax TaxID=35708 RepID=A0A0A9AA09_ARUDO
MPSRCCSGAKFVTFEAD